MGFCSHFCSPFYKNNIHYKQKPLFIFKRQLNQHGFCSAFSPSIYTKVKVMSNSLRPHGLYSPWDFPDQNTGVGSLSLLQGIFSTQGPNPGLLHCRWILYQLSHQGSPRILEWVAYPSPVNLPHPGIQPGSPALQVDSSPVEVSGKLPKRFILKFLTITHIYQVVFI